LELIGIDHPIVNEFVGHWRKTPPETIGAAVNMGLGQDAILTLWLVQAFAKGTDSTTHVIPLVLDLEGKRVPTVEKRFRDCFEGKPSKARLDISERQRILRDHIRPTLQRELSHRGIATRDKGYSTEILAWVELQ